MTSRDFCYWLQGFFEIQKADNHEKSVGLSSAQADVIQNHLNLVFHHEIDPSFTNDPVEQSAMNQIHAGFNSYLDTKTQDPAKSVMRC